MHWNESFLPAEVQQSKQIGWIQSFIVILAIIAAFSTG